MAIQPETATNSNIEEIEIKLLLEGVYLRHRYDFREYALPPLRRNVAAGMAGIKSGYLALGQRESLIFCPESSRYEQVRSGVHLFHKVR